MTTTENTVSTVPLLTPLATVKPEKVTWFWAHDEVGIIPLGTLTLIAGAGGAGKSSLVLDLVARATRGELPGELAGRPCSALLSAPEDDAAAVIVPRLTAADADLNQIHLAQAQAVGADGQRLRFRDLRFPDDVPLLANLVEETGARVIVIDPASSAMRGKVNALEDVRAAYQPLATLAQEKKLAIILIHHFNKSAEGAAGARVSGSSAWRDLTRCVLLFAAEGHGGVMTVDKSNYGQAVGVSLRYALENVAVPLGDNGEFTEVGRAQIVGRSELSVQDVMNRVAGVNDPDRTEIQQFLVDYLAGSEERRALAQEVIAEGRKLGYTAHQMRRARESSPEIAIWKPKQLRPPTYWALVQEVGEKAA